MSRVSIFALGIMPYVSAFIIVQLASRIVPRLRCLAAGGTGRAAQTEPVCPRPYGCRGRPSGRRCRVGPRGRTGLVAHPAPLFEATTVVTLVAGAIF